MHIPLEERIRVVSKRDRVYLRPDEIMFDVDRTNPVFGNPFKITETCSREEAIRFFSELLEKDLAEHGPMSRELDNIARLSKTRYVALRCWCAPQPCHADHIRLALINRLQQHEHD